MLNTTYNELLTLCVNNNITTASDLSSYLEYPAPEILSTIVELNKGKETPLFKKVQQEMFKQSDWFDNDYEFYPDEDIAAVDDKTFVTSHGAVLTKMTITKYGKDFCKFKERSILMARDFPCIELQSPRRKIRLAKLIATHFVPKPVGKEHLNRVKTITDNVMDCYYKNLEWF